MKIRFKGEFRSPVLYSLPLHDSGIPSSFDFDLMQKLTNNIPVYDHLDYQLPDGDYVVIFYDDYNSPDPKVVKAILGYWERIGETFDFDQPICYKFTPKFEVEVFPQESELDELFHDERTMFTSYGKNRKKI